MEGTRWESLEAMGVFFDVQLEGSTVIGKFWVSSPTYKWGGCIGVITLNPIRH